MLQLYVYNCELLSVDWGFLKHNKLLNIFLRTFKTLLILFKKVYYSFREESKKNSFFISRFLLNLRAVLAVYTVGLQEIKTIILKQHISSKLMSYKTKFSLLIFKIFVEMLLMENFRIIENHRFKICFSFCKAFYENSDIQIHVSRFSSLFESLQV